MKSTKKILLLVLSLVMLIGLFAVCAFAEEADAATVVYPDGSQASVAVGEEIPGVDGTLCYAPGNTLYKDCTITGATDGTVPADAAGQTITITGTKVYFTVTVAGGETTYYTDEAKAGSDLHNYMYKDKAESAAEIKLYADISGNITHFKGPNAIWCSLDLNGHELANTASLCVCGKLSLYSSQPGGVYRATATTMITTTNWTNNGSRIDGAFQIGEKKDSESLGYGKNLTVYCNQIVNNLGTQPSYIVGGTFVQNEGSTAAYLFSFYRENNPGGSLLQKVCNANFVITNPETAVFHAVTSNTRTIENCTFVCTAQQNAPCRVGSFSQTYMGVKLVNCSFVNVIPAFLDWAYLTGMETCFFGTHEQSLFPTASKSVSAKLYLVHGTETKQITVLGKTYVLDGTIVTSTSDALLINFEGLGEEYWAVGSKPVKGSAEGAPAIVNVDGVNMYCQGLGFDFSGIAQIAEGEVVAAGSASAPSTYAVQEPLYFSTLEGGAYVYYYGDKAEAEAALIEKVKAGATLKLYADMTTEHVGDIEVANGLDLDLNGFTWTVDITAEEEGKPSSCALYIQGTASIHSTVKGGKMVLAEDADQHVKGLFYMGDGHGPLYLGEAEQNTTFECDRLVYSALYGNGMYIRGGIFVQNSAAPVDYFISVSSSTRFKDCDNAIFIMNNAKAFFDVDRFYTGTTNYCDNNAIISANPMALFKKRDDVYNNTMSCVFRNSDFYNVYVSGTSTNYTAFDSSCNFNLTSADVQSNGYVAYTGSTVTKNILGENYVFAAALVPVAQVGIVDFGFGRVECYKVGLTVESFTQIVDGIFGYQYAGFTVAAGEQTAQKALVAIANGYITMNLTLQSSIRINLALSEKLAGATVIFDGEAVSFEELVDGYCLLTKYVDPRNANAPVALTIQVGENVHEVNVVSVGNYANTILKNDAYAAVQPLTYAMVEYVRVMANDANFLKDALVPVGYEAQALAPVAASNQGSLLAELRFNLAGAIAVEFTGAAEAEGKTVTVKLANGRTVEGVIENGSVVFAGLYVNEFHGDMKIAVEGESYSFSLANYLAALQEAGTVTDAQAAALNALYNYTYYADLYVRQ